MLVDSIHVTPKGVALIIPKPITAEVGDVLEAINVDGSQATLQVLAIEPHVFRDCLSSIKRPEAGGLLVRIDRGQIAVGATLRPGAAQRPEA